MQYKVHGHYLNTTGIEDAIKNAPEGTTALDLSRSRLGSNEYPDRLAKVIMATPATVSELDLSSNSIGEHKTSADLAKALALVPKTVKILDLSNNKFEQLQLIELKDPPAIPTGVKVVCLSYSEVVKMNEKQRSALKVILRNVPYPIMLNDQGAALGIEPGQNEPVESNEPWQIARLSRRSGFAVPPLS
jgi:hypothetical protein